MISITTFEELAAIPGTICLEKDFVLCPNLTQLPHIESLFQSALLAVLICKKGRAALVVGESSTMLTAGDALVCKPLTTLRLQEATNDAQVAVLLYSPQAINSLLPAKQNLSQTLECGFQPHVRLGQPYVRTHIHPLLAMLGAQEERAAYPFHTHTLFHLFAVLLFEVFNRCVRTAPSATDEGETRQRVARADSHFNEFVKLLTASGGRQRTVAYYADKLCITSKHLSKIVKQKTGKRALEVINSHAIHQIKLDLLLTDIPISQLADKYHFGNFSFFCQFVKAHLGMTPQAYRAQRKKEDQ